MERTNNNTMTPQRQLGVVARAMREGGYELVAAMPEGVQSACESVVGQSEHGTASEVPATVRSWQERT
jgi:hypothetical protein